FDRHGAQVKPEHPAAIEDRAKLDADESVVPSAFDGPAHQQLVVTAAVKIAGVQEVNAAVQRSPDGSDAFVFIFRFTAPNRRHAHAAQSEFGHERAVLT